MGFAIKKKFIGQGAERVAFLMYEIDKNNQPVGNALVAKDSLYVENKYDQLEFHKSCG